MKKITIKEVQDQTEEYVILSYSEVIYIVDNQGIIIEKLENGQCKKVTPEEVVKFS